MAALSFLRVEGTPFDAGLALGRFGAVSVHGHLLKSDAWHSVMCWRGSKQAELMTGLVKARFPRVWSELMGLAKGLEVPLGDVFLWNCRGDLWALAPDGCTTVQWPGESQRRISHNEDGDPGFAGHCAIAECSVEGAPDFAAFVYPGSLPGHTFAVTDGGLAMTVNNLRFREVQPGVPRMVLTRALLEATSLEAAVGLLQQEPRAGGFHLTLAHRDSVDLLTVEFAAPACSVHTVVVPRLHANHAVHDSMKGLPQVITGSSAHRQTRGDELVAGAGATARGVDPLQILGDRFHAKFPIHRTTPDDDDIENTLATVDIVVNEKNIAWEVREHPLEAPVYRMINAHRVLTAR